MHLSALRTCLLLYPLLASPSLSAPFYARRPGPSSSTEADVSAVITAFRQALAAGDSARARAAFTRSAWILDETERPLHRRFVGQAGCRSWCRPVPPLQAYRLRVLPDSVAALAVETYRATFRVSPAHRRRRVHEYTVVSVLTQQDGQWRISAQTLYQRLAK